MKRRACIFFVILGSASWAVGQSDNFLQSIEEKREKLKPVMPLPSEDLASPDAKKTTQGKGAEGGKERVESKTMKPAFALPVEDPPSSPTGVRSGERKPAPAIPTPSPSGGGEKGERAASRPTPAPQKPQKTQKTQKTTKNGVEAVVVGSRKLKNGEIVTGDFQLVNILTIAGTTSASYKCNGITFLAYAEDNPRGFPHNFRFGKISRGLLWHIQILQ